MAKGELGDGGRFPDRPAASGNSRPATACVFLKNDRELGVKNAHAEAPSRRRRRGRLTVELWTAARKASRERVTVEAHAVRGDRSRVRRDRPQGARRHGGPGLSCWRAAAWTGTY